MSHAVLTLNDLRAFVAVAEAAGFRRASRIAGVKQSVLSRRISNLEDTLGASLFERSRDGVRLTNAGSRFLRDIRPVFARLDTAYRAVTAAGLAVEGCIRIGTIAPISGGFLGQLLQNWRRFHSDVAIEFQSGLGQEAVGQVIARQSDLAIVTGSPKSPEYDTETLWSESVFIALPMQHELAGQSSIALEDLRAQRFLIMRHPPGPDIYDWIVRRLPEIGFDPIFDEQAVGRETLMSLVGHGFGVTFASTSETTIRYPNVSFVRVRGEDLSFSFVWSPANDNPALRRFLSEARVLSRGWSVEPSQMPDPSP